MVGRGGNSLCRRERASGPSHHLRDRGGLDDGPRLRRIELRYVLLRRHRYRTIIYPILAVAAVATQDRQDGDQDDERPSGTDY